MRRDLSSAAVVLFLLAAPSLFAADAVKTLLDSKALQSEYNPVLVDFLLEEGKTKLPAAQQKLALDQQVARFRQEAEIKPSEQLTASVATLAGMLIDGDAGEGIAAGAADVWREWVDAAFVLASAGYKNDAIPFFRNCVANFVYEELQARCARGLVVHDPDNAMTFLLSLLDAKKNATEVTNAALRMLGDVAADEATKPAQRDLIVAELIKKTEGMMNNVHYAAAIDGLVRSGDARAVEPLRKMTKGMTKGAEEKRAALRGLAVRFTDAQAIAQLQGMLKGGMMATEGDDVFAAVTLIAAGQKAGFDWAAEQLLPKKKGGGLLRGLASSKSKTDPAPALIHSLIESSSEDAKAVLARTADARGATDAIGAAAHVALLELGDMSRAEKVKAIVNGDHAFYTISRGAIALAKQASDYSGIPVLMAMASERNAKPPRRIAVADSLSRIDHDEAVAALTLLLADKDAGVRGAAAYALIGMKRPSAVDGLAKALEVSYERTPEVHAAVLRYAGMQFGSSAQMKTMLARGKDSPHASVQLLAQALSASPPSATAAKPKAPGKKKS